MSVIDSKTEFHITATYDRGSDHLTRTGQDKARETVARAMADSTLRRLSVHVERAKAR